MTETCESCAYFQRPATRMPRGQCRRFPQALDKFRDEWCGEHARVPAARDEAPIPIIQVPLGLADEMPVQAAEPGKTTYFKGRRT